jgi:hypothetical protein
MIPELEREEQHNTDENLWLVRRFLLPLAFGANHITALGMVRELITIQTITRPI